MTNVQSNLLNSVNHYRSPMPKVVSPIVGSAIGVSSTQTDSSVNTMHHSPRLDVANERGVAEVKSKMHKLHRALAIPPERIAEITFDSAKAAQDFLIHMIHHRASQFQEMHKQDMAFLKSSILAFMDQKVAHEDAALLTFRDLWETIDDQTYTIHSSLEVVDNGHHDNLFKVQQQYSGELDDLWNQLKALSTQDKTFAAIDDTLQEKLKNAHGEEVITAFEAFVQAVEEREATGKVAKKIADRLKEKNFFHYMGESWNAISGKVLHKEVVPKSDLSLEELNSAVESKDDPEKVISTKIHQEEGFPDQALTNQQPIFEEILKMYPQYAKLLVEHAQKKEQTRLMSWELIEDLNPPGIDRNKRLSLQEFKRIVDEAIIRKQSSSDNVPYAAIRPLEALSHKIHQFLAVKDKFNKDTRSGFQNLWKTFFQNLPKEKHAKLEFLRSEKDKFQAFMNTAMKNAAQGKNALLEDIRSLCLESKHSGFCETFKTKLINKAKAFTRLTSNEQKTQLVKEIEALKQVLLTHLAYDVSEASDGPTLRTAMGEDKSRLEAKWAGLIRQIADNERIVTSYDTKQLLEILSRPGRAVLAEKTASSIVPPRTIPIKPDTFPGEQALLAKRRSKSDSLTPMRSTGYWIKKGETLTVKWRNTAAASNVSPAVWIHRLDDATDKYKNAQKVLLDQEITTITAEKDGIIYIAGTDPSIAGTVTLESGGHPMPRFILGQHHHTDWEKMLHEYGGAPYAEFISDRVMMTATLAHAKEYVDDPIRSLTLWDKIVATAEGQFGQLAGKDEPHAPTKGLYHLVEAEHPYHAFGAAHSWRILFNGGMIKNALNYQMLRAADPLPLHELGHYIEMRDLFDYSDWHQVNTDLTVLHIRKKLLKKLDALKGWGIWPSIQAYLEQPTRDLSKLPAEDSRVKLGFYWQLALTFDDVFFQRCGIIARQFRGDIPWEEYFFEKVQDRLAVILCLASGYDLMKYFDKWGFVISDGAKKIIASLHLKALEKPIWENTDDAVKHQYMLGDENEVLLPETVEQQLQAIVYSPSVPDDVNR